MIPLNQIKIASPCHASWEEMTGTEQVRFCGGCRKNVYNLSEMTRDEAQALVEEKEGRLCVRFYTRADGTMLTQDCPVGLRAIRYRRARKMSYAAALLLSCGAGLLRGTGTALAVTPAAKPHMARPAPRHTMGKIAMPRPKTTNLAVGPNPFALPNTPTTHTMGLVSVPMYHPSKPYPKLGKPIMGSPPPPAQTSQPLMGGITAEDAATLSAPVKPAHAKP